VARKIFQILLGVVALAYVIGGALAIAGLMENAREAPSIWRAYAIAGGIFVVLGLLAGGLVWLANKWWWTLLIAGLGLFAVMPIILFAAAWIVEEQKATVHRNQINEETHSGRGDFGDQPALFAVARAIAANDQEAIRAAAKAVPNLQEAGNDGATLLCWTVKETWQRPELVAAVKTLLSLGADPNYNNGHRNSFALGWAVHGPAEGLRAMLDAGGNPNSLNAYGWPLVFMRYKLSYYQNEELTRLDLLLDHGADINAVVPEKESECPGCTLLLYTTQNGLTAPLEYDCALHLLEKGADPNRAAADGTNLAKMLKQQREKFEAEKRPPPGQFKSLWAWAESHGIVSR
jgi:hypothetical protein